MIAMLVLVQLLLLLNLNERHCCWGSSYGHLRQPLVHSLSYSVIPAILALGIITLTSQIMKMKHREVKVAFPELFHDRRRN